MIIWKPLVKKPTDKGNKNVVAVVAVVAVLIFIIKKWWLAMCNRNLHDCTHVFIPAPPRFRGLTAGKCINHGGDYGMEILVNFVF